MQNQISSNLIVTGRIGIVDAALVRYLENIKKRAEHLLIYVNESIYKEIIQKDHVKEFIANISFVDGVLEEDPETRSIVQQQNAYLIDLPEEKFQQYLLDRVLKKISIETSENKLETNKLIGLKELVKCYGSNPHQRKIKIGLVSGSFDLIHLGHVRYIKAAKELVDVLVVATMSTNSIKQQEKNIMGDRPIYSQEDRIKVLSSLQSVDYIVVFEELNCKEVIMAIKPNYFVKHEKDMSRQIVNEECKLVENLGGKVVITRDNTPYSSTDIINYIRNINSNER